MARQTSEEREQFWRDLIERQPASGVSIADFCRQAGVSANSFFVWKRRLRRAFADRRRSHRVSRQGKRTSAGKVAPVAKSFVPVRLIADRVPRNTSNPATIEVEWPSGLVLRVPFGFDASALREVLRALQLATDAEAPSC